MLLVLGADPRLTRCLMAMTLKNHIRAKRRKVDVDSEKENKKSTKSQPSKRREVKVLVFSIVDGCRHTITLK